MLAMELCVLGEHLLQGLLQVNVTEKVTFFANFSLTVIRKEKICKKK